VTKNIYHNIKQYIIWGLSISVFKYPKLVI